METRQRFQHGKEGIVDQLFWFDLGKRGGLIDMRAQAEAPSALRSDTQQASPASRYSWR